MHTIAIGRHCLAPFSVLLVVVAASAHALEPAVVARIYQVRTPTAIAGVRGTVLWGDTDLDAICVLDGRIEVRAIAGGGPPCRSLLASV